MSASEQYKYIKKMTTKEDIKAQMHYSFDKGREEGREELMQLMIMNLYKSGMSAKEIAERCVLPETKVETIIVNSSGEVK